MPTDDLAALDPDTAEAYRRMERTARLCRSCGEPELWRDGYCYDCWEVADFARIGKGEQK